MNNPKYAIVGDIRTRYFEKGSGEPLVLIHGGQYGSYDNARVWDLNFDDLSNSFHVFAFDRLGMGFTDNPKSDSEYSIGSTIKHACEFICNMGLDRVNLVGHSRGAFVAARIAIEGGNLVKSICVVDSNTLAPDHAASPKDFYDKIEAAAPPVASWKSVQAEITANSYSTDHVTNELVNDFLRIAQSREQVERKQKMSKLRKSLFMPDLNRRREETIDEITKGKMASPTIIAWGSDDPSAPVNLAYTLFDLCSRTIARCQLHIFNKSGHYCFREHANDFVPVLENFIKHC